MKKYCNCGNLSDYKTGYCKECIIKMEKVSKARERTSQHRYNNTNYERIFKSKEDNLCCNCTYFNNKCEFNIIHKDKVCKFYFGK